MKHNLFDIGFWNYGFVNAWMLLFLLVIPLLIYVYIINKNNKKASFKSGINHPKNAKPSLLKHFLFAGYLLALALLIVGFAKPYGANDSEIEVNKEYEGIDIVLALDLSTSMMAMDFKPNRLEASKKMAQSFIEGRTNDRIGLVVYEGEAFTKCPLTTDYSVLHHIIPNLYPGTMTEGTAIGTGLATAVNRLRDSKATSKVIILLSDGSNNSGEINPENAAKMAKTFGIKVYSIGMGTDGIIPVPSQSGGMTMAQSFLDESSLRIVAKETGGKYFRAKNEKALAEIYKEIDQLEKTKIDGKSFFSDPPTQHYSFIFMALFIGAITFSLDQILLRRITH